MVASTLAQTSLAHETLEILLSDLPDQTLTTSESVDSIIDQQHPVTELWSAAHIDRLDKRRLEATALLWNELLAFRRLVRRFRDDKIDVYPGWKFNHNLKSEIPVNLNNRLIRSSVFAGAWIARSFGRPSKTLAAWQKYSDAQEEFYGSIGPSFLSVQRALETFAEFFGSCFGTVVSSPGESSPFEVRSINSGYQIQKTPQYWMSPEVFGSDLSTPVIAELSDGIYRFGGSKSGKPTIWDPGIYSVSSTIRRACLTAV
jgi:hypothetical protein